MNQYTYEVVRSFINASPYLLIILSVLFVARGPFSRFISRNLFDSGKDRYSSKSQDDEKETQLKNQVFSEDELKKLVRDVLMSEGGRDYFVEYKENLNRLIEDKQSELAAQALSNVNSEEYVEEVVAQSLNDTLEKLTDKLIRESKGFKDLEKSTLDKLGIIKISSFLEHLEKEYDATRSTKALMSNMFIMVNVIYFFGLFMFLVIGRAVAATPTVYFALSFSYIGLGAFVVYMIKFCNARSLTLLSLREDFLKREQINGMASRMVELGTSEHHVALLQLMSSGVATKEQKINHPYEMLLYGIKDSNIMFKGGKFEVRKESSNKANP
ncbi:hypothetical protein [Enterobacter sp. HSTU-ASh6]|uniref:hypothetical protein n=1 Tax=Enterobacter sp. HSTU-ASh6 TaxID=2678687 RepID=UPI0022579D58|nr:hypothetical protein [Enterobacter sp. HSTU-ASh6]MCX4177882.1 hypothetical protein [Enterobacter sp. HSTU-ASh6]